MDNSTLKKYLENGENVNIEFKESRLGGYIFLGVKDSGEILGIDVECTQKIKRDFANQLNNPQKINPPLYIQLKEFVYEGKVILYAYIPESSSIHKLNNSRILDRNENGDYDITNNQNLIPQRSERKGTILMVLFPS